MPLFAKILAILNVLAAGVFFYLAVVDWGVRQAWSYQVFRHELALHGLPVDDQDNNWRLPGLKIVPDLSDETLQDVFAKGEGPPVRTLHEEVERKRDELVAEINGLDEARKRDRLRTLLLPLARTGDERDDLARQIADPAVPPDSLIDRLRGKFDEPLTSESPGGEQRDILEKRQAIAHLLYNLDADLKWHQRVMIILGMVSYARAADSQAAALVAMSDRMDRLLADDKRLFVAEYQRTLQRIVAQADQIVDKEIDLKVAQDQKEKHLVIVAARENDIKEMMQRLEEARQKTVEGLKLQREMEFELFSLHHALGTVVEDNLRLERQIRQLESKALLTGARK